MKLGEFAYILVTPAKDEEESLPTLIHSIVNQSIRPVAWFVVDDNSEDRTGKIIDEVISEYPWIHSLKQNVKRRYELGEHYASVCITGFDFAMDYCKKNDIDFVYIALSDADIIYPENYFEQCMNYLHDNRQYGIVSGKVLVKDKEGTIYGDWGLRLDGIPHGTGRVWRREAFTDTNGYLVAKAPDTVSNIMAELKGWKVKRLTNIECYQTRETKGKHSLWRGYLNRGENAYYVNTNPLSMFNTVVDILFISREKRKLIKSLALFSGYWKSFFLRKQKLDNDEVKRYVGSYRRVIRHYWMFLEKSLSGKGRYP